MAYFPMFLDMNNLKVLLIGGGDIATHKLERLLDFTKDITIIALEVNTTMGEMLKSEKITLHQRAYKVGELEDFDVVIIATNSVALHKSIYEESRNYRILVNSVDNVAYCDFIFPSYLQKGELTIAFSTGGASPAFDKLILNYF